MNHITLIGRLAKDPELKYSQSGKAYCRFTLAVAREFNRDEVDFINCLAWDKRAEAIAEYLRKGRRMAVQGRIQTGSYQNNNGDTVYTTDIIVDKFEFVDSARSDTSKNVRSEEDLEDDFPFN